MAKKTIIEQLAEARKRGFDVVRRGEFKALKDRVKRLEMKLVSLTKKR